LGMALAYWVDHALVALAPQQIKGSELTVNVYRDVNPDWRVLLFTLGITILVALLSGLAPAIRSTRQDMGRALQGNSSVRAPGRFSLANALVVAQVALSLALLIGAGLFLRSLDNLKSVNPGFHPEQIILMTVDLTW